MLHKIIELHISFNFHHHHHLTTVPTVLQTADLLVRSSYHGYAALKVYCTFGGNTSSVWQWKSSQTTTCLYLCSPGPGRCRSNQVCSLGIVVQTCCEGSADILPSGRHRRCGLPARCCCCRDTPHNWHLAMPGCHRNQGCICRTVDLKESRGDIDSLNTDSPELWKLTHWTPTHLNTDSLNTDSTEHTDSLNTDSLNTGKPEPFK